MRLQVTHDNHFVPKWYLKRWADRAGLVWCYPLVVQHENVPLWDQRPLSGVAYRRDLYTLTSTGQDIDDFERWLTAKYEDPAKMVVDKAVAGRRLTQEDWRTLVLFAVAQDLRTPQHFIEAMQRWRDQFPEVIQSALEDAIARIERLRSDGKHLPTTHSQENLLGDALTFTINRDAHPETEQGEVGVHLLLGRDFWLREQRHVLEGLAERFVRHSWSIAESSKHIEWFTSDHPVVRLNWYGDGRFDVRGGWGKPGGNICMPLSRRHLLFTEIGTELPSRFRLTRHQSLEVRKAIAARAWRTIFALRPVDDIARLRPRLVDAEACTEEHQQWTAWHCNQTEAEREHFSNR